MKLIDKALDYYLPSAKDEPRILHKAMRYSVFSGGKRLRPMIVIESCKACGGSVKDAIPCAAAVEMVHAYSLIHDDLPSMDDDDYRRGKPACHKVFGEANAILAGDTLLTLAFNVIAGNLKPETARRAIKELTDALGSYGMAGGQAMDLRYKAKKKNKNTPDNINRLKTAKLFEACAKLGAISAGVDNKKIEALARYGINFGMAFQTADDIDDGENAHSSRKPAVMIARARAALKIFGKKAEALKRLAEWNEK